MVGLRMSCAPKETTRIIIYCYCYQRESSSHGHSLMVIFPWYDDKISQHS
uniref:Uncharacterized protein n=1 Tax=Arion vulgaris TaxID=1028688 RepID=A0A0B6ZU49_9EUPU